jgi:tetratricopeptide (TPR) repeat protein
MANAAAPLPDDRPLVFVSYSHKDEVWKDRVVEHLRNYELDDLLEVWEDRQIEAGADWYANIKDVLRRTRCAVCLISPSFLASRFCRFEEIPYLLQQRRKGNLEIVPVLVRDSDWSEQRWLKRLQMLPRDGKNLVSHYENDPDPILKAVARRARDAIEPGYKTFRPPPAGTPPEKVDIDRLPETGALLFGRREELAFLDRAWAERKLNVVVFRASGGVGKSTLVRCWTEELAEDNYQGAERVFAWSFYSQGAGDSDGKPARVTSADQFISEALHFFGDGTRGEGLSARDRGHRLAELLCAKRTLLLLDGMEPLQSTHSAVQRGEITDPGLATLVEELARYNPGLCIVSTREPIANLADSELGDRVAEKELNFVAPLAGRALLRERGVNGKDKELENAVRAFGGHAYALQLVGRYLELFGGSQITAAADIPAGAEFPDESRHPRRVMVAFAKKFGEDSAEVELLHVLGLFDRPIEPGAIAALRAQPIPGLTMRLATLDDGTWRGLLDRLRAAGLVSKEASQKPGEIDAHPLVREHFGAELRKKIQAAWRAGHERLYEYFKEQPEREQPDTLEELTPLFQAVFHGCQAGRHQKALDEVYWARIARGNEAYVIHKLGAFGADLAALACFFESPWAKPVASITALDKAFVLGEAGFRLRALGRLRDAVPPIRAALKGYRAAERWNLAARNAGNLSELQLTLGEVVEAIVLAKQSVDHADRGGDAFLRTYIRAILAYTTYLAGGAGRAEALFQEAEQLQAERQPSYPRLYSLQGYQYCDLLLDLGQYAEVRERACYAIEIARQNSWLLDIALDHLSLGRAELVAQEADGSGDPAEVERQLNQAVDGVRKANRIDHLPLGLLGRAAYSRVAGEFDRARRDLDEVMRIATRSGMRLFECDAHLELARLALAEGDPAAARPHLGRAAALVQETGYHRRDDEVKKLRDQLGQPG